MAARDHLMEEEYILANCPPFYATTRRILRCETKNGQEEVHELPYFQISTVELVRRPHHKRAISGVLMSFVGLILWMMGLYTPILAVFLGIGLIVWGARGQESHYQFEGYNMGPEDLSLWQVPFRGSAGFIGAVGEHVRRPLQGYRP